MPAELAGNLPSRVLGKAVHGETRKHLKGLWGKMLATQGPTSTRFPRTFGTHLCAHNDQLLFTFSLFSSETFKRFKLICDSSKNATLKYTFIFNIGSLKKSSS